MKMQHYVGLNKRSHSDFMHSIIKGDANI